LEPRDAGAALAKQKIFEGMELLAENNPSICVSKSFCDFFISSPMIRLTLFSRSAGSIMTLRKFDVHSMKAWL
jgi:hypothetical protein